MSPLVRACITAGVSVVRRYFVVSGYSAGKRKEEIPYDHQRSGREDRICRGNGIKSAEQPSQRIGESPGDHPESCGRKRFSTEYERKAAEAEYVHLNVLFRDAGLLEVDPNGGIYNWKAYAQANGFSTTVHLVDNSNKKLYIRK